MRRAIALAPVFIAFACGGGHIPAADTSNSIFVAAPESDGGGDAAPSDGGPGAGYSGPIPGPPPTVCTPATQLVDVSNPTTVVGNGTAASCTEQALYAAALAGGIVTFNCGSAPVTITVTNEVPVTKSTTIDGGHLVTLSGGKSTRILHIKSAWNVATPLLTVQNLTFTDGFTSDAPNTTSTAKGGAAIFEDGGSLAVIGCTFVNNQCASTGQDVSGGAINGQGVGTLIVEGSVFAGNSGSNGGAIGTQDESVTVSNSTLVGNSATGTGGNPGNGGDGGALTYDGANIPLTMCGDTFSQNRANAAGGAVFRVAYNDEAVNIDRSTFDSNSVDAGAGNAGGLYLEFATITMTGSTISHNSAHFGGGIWIGHNAIANITNDTIADNTAQMGGGVWFAGGVTGTFLNVTVAGNPGNGMAGGGTGVVLQNTLVSDNTAGSLEGEAQCDHTHGSAGVNMEDPLDSSSPCTSSVQVADPQLGSLQNNGGPTATMLPAAGSPAIGKGTGCPATDQRGHARASACTLGSVEAQ